MTAARVPTRRFDLVPAARLLALAGDVTDDPDGDPLAWAWKGDLRAPAPPVIAIDVGADAAAAVITDTHAEVVGFRFPNLGIDSFENLDEALHAVGVHVGRPVFIIEDTFMGGRANVRTKAGLDRRVGAIASWCWKHGPIVRVLAAQWQPDVIGKVTRETGKQRSLDVARARFPKLAIGSDHEADALLMAWWARGGRGTRRA